MSFANVTCPRCLSRIAEIEKSGWSLMTGGQELFRVGNVARPAMGHQLYFTRTGRIALCIAQNMS